MTKLADITLNLTPEKLTAVYALMDGEQYPLLYMRNIRAKMAILAEVAVKLGKKQLDKPKGSKPFALKLKYYEADVLEEFLRNNADRIEDEYSYTLAKGVCDTLHQRLE